MGCWVPAAVTNFCVEVSTQQYLWSPNHLSWSVGFLVCTPQSSCILPAGFHLCTWALQLGIVPTSMFLQLPKCMLNMTNINAVSTWGSRRTALWALVPDCGLWSTCCVSLCEEEWGSGVSNSGVPDFPWFWEVLMVGGLAAVSSSYSTLTQGLIDVWKLWLILLGKEQEIFFSTVPLPIK